MPTPNADRAAAWKALNPQQREQALARMTQDQKMTLATDLGYKADAPATPPAAPTAPSQEEDWRDKYTKITPHKSGDIRELMVDPMAVGREVATTFANIGSGGLGMILHPIDTLAGIGGVVTAPYEVMKDAVTGNFSNPNRTPTVYEDLYHSLREAPVETVEAGVGQAAVPEAIGEFAGPATKALKGKVAKVGDTLKSKYGPRSVSVGDADVPVLVGEASPDSGPGRLQTSLKRSGAGQDKFEKVEQAQQEAVKGVIRDTARKTSGAIGPMQVEPSRVVNDAATASYAQAAPLYNELDAALVKVPDALKNVSRITQDAIAKARKLGVDVGTEEVDLSKITPDKDGSIKYGGTRISKATHPERWQKLVEDGIIDDSGEATPLKAYRQVRSRLLAMQRASSDPAFRFAVGKDIETMGKNIEIALKGTDVEKNWNEANRLWSKGKALQDVSEAVRDATKGTPVGAQAPGVTPVPTKLQGASLVAKLNDLYEDGTLQKAFDHDEILNLRQAADILDRIQRTPVGKGSGESMSMSRGLTHAIRGNTGPLVGAGSGFLIGGIHGAELGAGLGFVLQKIGEQGLIRVMTKLDGVKALKSLEAAKTPAQTNAAVAKIVGLGAAVVGPRTRQLQEMRQLQ